MQKVKKILVIATGGTIAGVGIDGENIGYKSGQVAVETLVDELKLSADSLKIETAQLCNINSDDITDAIWIELVNMINERAKDDIDGFVITHGTDTLEETAYFLNLTVKTQKPVVLTGSMRPDTAISKDGPGNLRDAIMVAGSPLSIGRGVLVVFAGRIISARFVTKKDTISVDAMDGGLCGAMGTVVDDEIVYFYHIDKRHTEFSEFCVDSGIKEIKHVNTLYFQTQTSLKLLKCALENSDGVVIAGAGMGEYSEEFTAEISKADIPIVISSRVPNGWVNSRCVLNSNVIATYDLNPQKAAVLLRLALTLGQYEGKKIENLSRLFMEY